MDNRFFENICNELCLGTIKEKVKSVSSGFMHRMYRLRTSSGDYAVKLLNPVIMQRPDVFDNYTLAESLERKLYAADIPIVQAIEYNNKKMQCIHGQYFYIFDWVNGKALKSKQIKKEHCAAIGETLAKIHKLECEQKEIIKNDLNIDWDFYIFQAERLCPEIVPLLSENRELLYKSQQEGNESFCKIPKVTCICNGDMDSKNVLWVDNKPQIIDLECLNYGNPYMEMFQLALCWSGYEHCHINYDLLKTFIKSYVQEYGEFAIDWSALYCSNIGRLEWLEYNAKRALRIECSDEAERKLGIGQVKETMKHIVYYDKIRLPLISQLEQCF